MDRAVEIPNKSQEAPGRAVPAERIRPDRELVRSVLAEGGEDMKRCMQCATCSVACDLSDETNPFPRKEMMWAQWGLRHRLMADADIWLCHQCSDCTRRCPRGARPGDVMAALRRECAIHYSRPRAFGRWVNHPRSLPVLLLGAILILLGAAWLWQGLGFTAWELGSYQERVVIPFWKRFPHGLLCALFLSIVALDAILLLFSGWRFSRALARNLAGGASGDGRGATASFSAVLSRVFWHDDFSVCNTARSRGRAHALVVYGFAALLLVDLWVVTARFNPMLVGLVYPLGALDAWKLLANAAGLGILTGCGLMLRDRWRRSGGARAGTYADWVLLGLLMCITITGFASEVLHYARLAELRWGAYLVHLATVLVLLIILPYSKLAHAVYRTVALVHAERCGRGRRASRTAISAPSPEPAHQLSPSVEA